MKNFLFLLAILIFIPAKAQVVEEYECYDIDTNTVYYTKKDTVTGKTLATGTFVGKKKSGAWYQYYPNGKVHFYSNYNSGMKHGKWKSWDEQGRILTKQVYRRGRLLSTTISRYY